MGLTPVADTTPVLTAGQLPPRNAPHARDSHTAVWTGSEMIVWGGFDRLGSGGKYAPSTDSWTATAMTEAPAGRFDHTALWTGIEMIVWGGVSYGQTTHYYNTGGKYSPLRNSWTATTTTNAPSGREHHTAVWTGSEMVVWGGWNGTALLDTGGDIIPTAILGLRRALPMHHRLERIRRQSGSGAK